MSNVLLEGMLLDTTGQMQCAVTGAIAYLSPLCSIPVDSSGQPLMVEEASQARIYLCGIARATTSNYVIFDASGAATAFANGLPVTATGALVVDLSGVGAGNFCAGVSFTSAGKVRATGLS